MHLMLRVNTEAALGVSTPGNQQENPISHWCLNIKAW